MAVPLSLRDEHRRRPDGDQKRPCCCLRLHLCPFPHTDDDVSIFVSFFPSLTRYDLRLSLNYKNNKDMEVRPETYEVC